jgi:hypothetical protein
MREYMEEYRERNKPPNEPPQRDSARIIRQALDDKSLMERLRTMPRPAAYNHLFVRLNLTQKRFR